MVTGKTFEDDDRLEYGQKGEVMGPEPGDASGLAVKFDGDQINTVCLPTELSRSKPPKEVRYSTRAFAG